MESNQKPRTFGMIGSIIGLIALAAIVLHFFFGPIADPQPVESFVADTTVRIKEAIQAKVKGEKYVAPVAAESFDPDLIVERGAVISGLVAVALGVFGLLRKEEALPNGLALGLGGASIAFSFSIAIAGVIVFAIIVAAIVSGLGLDIGI